MRSPRDFECSPSRRETRPRCAPRSNASPSGSRLAARTTRSATSHTRYSPAGCTSRNRVAFLAGEYREGLSRSRLLLPGMACILSLTISQTRSPQDARREGAALERTARIADARVESESLTTARRAEKLLRAVADLYVNGYAPDWRCVNGGDWHRAPMPGYPFQRRRYWLEPCCVLAAGWDVPEPARVAEAEGEGNVDYAPVWTPRPLTSTAEGREASPLLIFDGSDALAVALRRMGERVLHARPGDAFEAVTADEWRLNPEAPEHYTRLLSELEGEECRRAPSCRSAARGPGRARVEAHAVSSRAAGAPPAARPAGIRGRARSATASALTTARNARLQRARPRPRAGRRSGVR